MNDASEPGDQHERTIGSPVGEQVVGPDDELVGRIVEVFLDADTDEAEWVALALVEPDCDGCFTVGTEAAPGRFAPVVGLDERADGMLRLRWTREHVLASPVEITDIALTNDEEDALYLHYGVDQPKQWINNGAPGGGVVVGVAGIAADRDRS